jgi:hypothetical protein
MSMTLQNMIDEVFTYNTSFDLDEKYLGSATTQQKVDTINKGIRTISKQIFQYDPKIALTLTADQNSYDLRNTAVVAKKVIRPYQVIINKNMLWNAAYNEYGIWTLAELERNSPSWRTDPSATPSKAVYYGNQKLILHPAPTQAIIDAGNNYISGQYLAANLTTSDLSNYADIPEELHEAVCYCAAAFVSLPNLSEQEAWQRVGAYNSEWKTYAEQMRQENMRAIQATGSTSGYANRRFMIL